MIYARLGNESGYEVVRGARVECGDGENYAGVPILGWDCDIETVRAFAREQVAQDIDWSACWDSALPSRAGCVEAPLVCSLERAEQIVAQINAAATRAPREKKDRRLAPRPAVGDVVTVHGVKAKVFRIHPFGTIDVVTLDGKRAWRITGLAF